MADDIVNSVRGAGVVGAGGAGFPTHVKLASKKVEVVIANGAECEPLSQADLELMVARTPEIIRGLRTVIQATGAARGVIAVKRKHKEVLDALRQALAGSEDITVFELGNFYPAGDEQVLVYDVLGRVVPEGGLPLNVGAVVQNIETLFNIEAATHGVPVTKKHITVVGEVPHPMTVRVPVGVPFREVLDLAGGSLTPEPVILVGGAMMGHVARDLDEPVTKTTKMLLVLPNSHELSLARQHNWKVVMLRAISACDQCFMCTDFCPRHAQGHAIEPHRLILMMAAGVPLTDERLAIAHLCCECRTCNYACPVHLSPGDFAISVKRDLLRAGAKNPYHRQTEANPYRDFRRVPADRLMNRLGLARYDLPAPLTEAQATFRRVTLLMKQHIGAPANPVVAVGDKVQVGDLVGEIPEGAMGARVHASIAGVVRQVSKEAVVIEAE